MKMTLPTYRPGMKSTRAICFALLLVMASSTVHAQTSANTVITNQAQAVYKYKSLPQDTTRSNAVLFSVLDAPNFEMSFSNRDTLTFGKDTVAFRIVYKNVGNKIADSATIEGMLPPAGFRFVPGSTGGTIAGKTVTWRVFNIPSGKTDSVSVKAVVDSGLVMNTQLSLEANLSWQSSQITAAKTFIIASFPKLSVNLVPDRDFVGSGRDVTYRIIVHNTGNTSATSTIVYDTVSSIGTYISSSLTPESLAANKRLVKWNLGSVPAFSSKEISLTVRVQPNLGHQQIRNSVLAFSSNVPVRETDAVQIPVVPVLPKTISITPDPKFIFGQVNKDSSRITVVVKDSVGEVLPDGTPVKFEASIANFINGTSQSAAVIQNGSAAATLRSINVDNDIVSSIITVTAGVEGIGTVQDTTSIHFYPGAVTGIVVNGINRIPFQGAIARVFNSQQTVIGSDTTKTDGKFFIALRKDVTNYTLEILVIDKFGDSIKSVSDIDPSRFPLPPIQIPNIISGRIEYLITGEPVAAPNVRVFLDSVATVPAAKPGRRSTARLAAKQSSYVRVKESITDSRGKFKFENLKPAQYIIALDSAEFPNFNGFTFLTDTASGTFTINLSLKITLDSSLNIIAQAPAGANAGDTITVGLKILNSGTAEHRSITVTDTLSPYMRLLSFTSGNFSIARYDSVRHTISWQRDTLNPLLEDSVSVRLAVSNNIPDRTIIQNRFWYNSNIRSAEAVTATNIRSSGIILFDNMFIVPKDTIIAGDSILHVFKYRNIGTDSLRNVRIVDTLFSAGAVGVSMFKQAAHDSLQIIDSISIIYLGSIPPGRNDSTALTLITDFALRQGTTVSSHAYLMSGDSIIASKDTLFVVAENPSLPSFISISKTANKKVAEIGDIVTYQVQITNSSPQPLLNIGVYDLLPYAFQYVRNSARFNGRIIEPAVHPAMNQLTWTVPDTIAPAKSITLVYQLAIGADALESEGMNTAYASAATTTGSTLVSSPSQWQVTVRPGVFTEKGLIIGKVFYDDNRNTFQDPGENGVKGIELWMEDGTKITTGNDGKFSLPEVKPGQHVMRINETTLPPKVRLLAGSNAFANDPVSRFVRVTEGGIAKANFFLQRTISDSIDQAVTKINKLVAVRQAVPKYLYVDTLRNIRQDTVTMYVSFNYSGGDPVRSIVVTDKLDQRMSLVPNSGSYNKQRLNPIIAGDVILWNVVPTSGTMRGVVSYKAVITNMPALQTRLTSTSTIMVTASDSSRLEIGHLITDNYVIDTAKNRIETSDVITSLADPQARGLLYDSIKISSGDDVFFKTTIYIDPLKKVKEATYIDTIPSSFIINERTFTINGIPVPSRNLSVRIRSMAISSTRNRMEENELEFFRISSLDMTELLRSGKNEISYSARFQSAKRDTVIRKYAYALIVDEFNDSSILHSKPVRIFALTSTAVPTLQLETTFVELPRPPMKVEEKIADAMKLVESLRKGTAGPVVMDGITFELSRSTLTAESKVVLDNIATILLENQDIRIQINGYTDNTGNAASNRKMSLNRAKEVATYLVGKGITQNRLLPQGFGPAKPIASNKTEEGRAKNRRVEFAPIQ
jgi:uncharacterized repeat protein (TIGR01451 family)